MQGIRTNAKKDGSDWILNGSKVCEEGLPEPFSPEAGHGNSVSKTAEESRPYLGRFTQELRLFAFTQELSCCVLPVEFCNCYIIKDLFRFSVPFACPLTNIGNISLDSKQSSSSQKKRRQGSLQTRNKQ